MLAAELGELRRVLQVSCVSINSLIITNITVTTLLGADLINEVEGLNYFLDI